MQSIKFVFILYSHRQAIIDVFLLLLEQTGMQKLYLLFPFIIEVYTAMMPSAF